MMPIALDRSICCDLNETVSREWLITNGLGAYAAGTVAGMLTRMEQGLLVACPPDTNVPQLLLAKIDEEVVFDQRTYYLGTNEYRDGTLNPSGFVHLETFRLEEGFPVFTYRLGGIDGIVLEKRIWMQQGRNTTYIQYRVIRTTTSDKNGRRRSGITGALSNTPARGDEENEATQQAVTLTLLPFTAYRPFNQPQHGHNDWHFQVHHHQPTHAMAGDAGETRSHITCSPLGNHRARRPLSLRTCGTGISYVVKMPPLVAPPWMTSTSPVLCARPSGPMRTRHLPSS